MNKPTRKLLSLALCCVMLISLLPVSAFAEQENEEPLSAQEEAPLSGEPETDEPETDEPETDEPETDEPETAEEPETDEPELVIVPDPTGGNLCSLTVDSKTTYYTDLQTAINAAPDDKECTIKMLAPCQLSRQTITVPNSKIINLDLDTYSVYSSTYNDTSTIIKCEGTLTVTAANSTVKIGSLSGTAVTVDGGELHFNEGSAFSGTGNMITVNSGTVEINGGSHSGEISCAGTETSAGTLTINGGSFNVGSFTTSGTGEIHLRGGMYQNSPPPAGFVDSGYAVLPSGDTTYKYKVEEHSSHSWTYSLKSGTTDTVTASCACGTAAQELTIVAPTGAVYDGSSHNASFGTATSFCGGALPAVTYQYKATADGTYADTSDTKNAGCYKASFTVGGAAAYVEYTVSRATPDADDFSFAAPANLIYSGSAKSVSVKSANGVSGMGAVNVGYYSDAACTASAVPTNAGTYYVGIKVSEGTNFNAVSGVLTSGKWKFTVSKAPQTAPAPTESGKTSTSVTLCPVAAGIGETTYAVSTGSTAPSSGWQTETVFTGLNIGTAYYFFAKYAGDKNHEAGISGGTMITTTSHEHMWNYSLQAGRTDTVTAVCEGTVGTCTLTDTTLTVTAPADTTYNSAPHNASFGTATSFCGGALPLISYEYRAAADGTYASTTDTKNAGCYKASFTVGGVTAYVEYTVSIEPVSYLDENGKTQTCGSYTIISKYNKPTAWSDGWYVVTGTADYTDGGTATNGIEVTGKAHLILTDGCSLTVKGENNKAGIRVSGGTETLTIYAQSTGSEVGTLTATGGKNGAGIGGGDGGSGSSITISGGTVTATGGADGAGIGGGDGGSGSSITISGGKVEANGCGGGAGIGGGFRGSGSDITISGGKVEANGDDDSAGIGGGGDGGSGSSITVNGGTVTATGGKNGAGIGGGGDGSGSSIMISGGYINATGSYGGEDIGAGADGTASDMKLSGGYYANVPKASYVVDGYYLAENPDSTTSGTYGCAILPFNPVSYLDENGKTQTCDSYTIINKYNKPITWTTGWYAVLGTADYTGGGTVANGIGVTGEAHLILTDGCFLTVKGETNKAGIDVRGNGKALTIYGQTGGTGTLTATGGYYGAGIGGVWTEDGNVYAGKDITINGGTVNSTGGYFGAGIGGGLNGGGSNITVNGGKVTAIGDGGGAGIGGGTCGSGSSIKITGGCINATSSGGGEDIGAGDGGTASKTTVQLSGGCYKNVPKAAYLDKCCCLTANPDTASSYKYTVVNNGPVSYLDADGVSQTCDSYTIINEYNKPTTWPDGWYAVLGTADYTDGGTATNGIKVTGKAHLILTDGCSLTVKGSGGSAGIRVSGGTETLTIYAQSTGAGALKASGGDNGGAGIGGGIGGSGGDITITGGKITAIGGGINSSASTGEAGETINYHGAGIGGGGGSGNGSNIIITGGYINASGYGGGEDIGGGGIISPLEGEPIRGKGDVQLSGGYYANVPKASYIVDGYYAVANTDEATSTDYPHKIILPDGQPISGSFTGSFFADGKPIVSTVYGNNTYLQIPAGVELLTYCEYQKGTDAHTSYPVSMKVWLLSYDSVSGKYTVTEFTELDNLLGYCGTSIRLSGKNGIRIITGINEALKKQLISGLKGYKLTEYGTVMAWTEKLGSDALTLDNSNAAHNYAYSAAKGKDPVFRREKGILQYTNVLPLDYLPESALGRDVTMRPYLKLADSEGRELVIYGGEVVRSVGYVAYQNRSAFRPGTNGYEYVWKIIHAVYGDQYDSEYNAK